MAVALQGPATKSETVDPQNDGAGGGSSTIGFGGAGDKGRLGCTPQNTNSRLPSTGSQQPQKPGDGGPSKGDVDPQDQEFTGTLADADEFLSKMSAFDLFTAAANRLFDWTSDDPSPPSDLVVDLVLAKVANDLKDYPPSEITRLLNKHKTVIAGALKILDEKGGTSNSQGISATVSISDEELKRLKEVLKKIKDTIPDGVQVPAEIKKYLDNIDALGKAKGQDEVGILNKPPVLKGVSIGKIPAGSHGLPGKGSFGFCGHVGIKGGSGRGGAPEGIPGGGLSGHGGVIGIGEGKMPNIPEPKTKVPSGGEPKEFDS